MKARANRKVASVIAILGAMINVLLSVTLGPMVSYSLIAGSPWVAEIAKVMFFLAPMMTFAGGVLVFSSRKLACLLLFSAALGVFIQYGQVIGGGLALFPFLSGSIALFFERKVR